MKPRQQHQTGAFAEWLCMGYLRLTGWRVLARRWRCHHGEIDLIAARGKTLAFIEVKARATHNAALASITATQQQRIRNAALLWMAKYPEYAGHTQRIDVFSFSKWPLPKHHKNMF